MKIYVYPADNFGCGKYRMWWPSEALQAQGVDLETVTPGDKSGIGGFAKEGRMTHVTFPPDADIIVLQRPSHTYLTQAVPMMRARGVTVVVDMDDDLSIIHPANPAFHLMHPRNGGESNWQNVAQACRDASLVTVSTDALISRYGSHGRVKVIRNCIPERFLKIEHEDSNVLGWAGALHSHPDDPRILGPALARVGRTLRVLGPPDPLLSRSFGCPVNPSGIIEFDEWPENVATLGVGIAPLADSRFNTCKSWLKPLEYAACGVPWVGSLSAEYKRLFDLGCGALATKPKEWAYTIRRLLDSPDARQELSEAGRLVAADLTIEANAWRWLEAWVDAYKREH